MNTNNSEDKKSTQNNIFETPVIKDTKGEIFYSDKLSSNQTFMQFSKGGDSPKAKINIDEDDQVDSNYSQSRRSRLSLSSLRSIQSNLTLNSKMSKNSKAVKEFVFEEDEFSGFDPKESGRNLLDKSSSEEEKEEEKMDLEGVGSKFEEKELTKEDGKRQTREIVSKKFIKSVKKKSVRKAEIPRDKQKKSSTKPRVSSNDIRKVHPSNKANRRKLKNLSTRSWIDSIVSNNSIGKTRIEKSINNKIEYYEGHEKSINDMIFSNKRDKIITASTDKTVRVWDIKSKKSKFTFKGRSNAFTSLAISSDDKFLCCGGRDRSIRVYDLEKGELIKVLSKNESPVKALAFTKDSKFLLTGYRGKIRVYDMKEFNVMIESHGHSSKARINKIIFSKSQKNFLTCGDDKKILVWDVKTFIVLHKFVEHEAPVKDIILGFEDKRMFSCSEEGKILIWDLKKMTLIDSFNAHKLCVNSLCLRQSQNQLLSASEDKRIKIWNLESLECIQTLRYHKNSVFRVLFSLNERYLFSCGWEKKAYRVDLKDTFSKNNRLKHPKGVLSIKSNQSGSRIYTGCIDRLIYCWDGITQKLKFTLSGHSGWVTSLALSEERNLLYSGADDMKVIFWDLKKNQLKKSFKHHKSKIASLTVIQDLRLLISGDYSKIVLIWDLQEERVLKKIDQKSFRINKIIYPDHPRNLIFMAMDRYIRTYNLKEFKFEDTIEDKKNEVLCLAYSHETQMLYSAGKDPKIKVWNFETKEKMKEFQGHEGAVKDMVLMEDLNTLASCSSDNTIRLWDKIVGNQIHVIKIFKDDVTSLDFCEDKTTLHCASYDKNVRSFSFSPLVSVDQVDYLCLVKIHSYFSSDDSFSMNEALKELVIYLKNYSEIYVLYNFDIISLLLCFDCEVPLKLALLEFGYPAVKKVENDPLNKFFSYKYNKIKHMDTISQYLMTQTGIIRIQPKSLELILEKSQSLLVKKFLSLRFTQPIFTVEGDLKKKFFFDVRDEMKENVVDMGNYLVDQPDELYQVSFKRTNYRICIENGTKGSYLMLKNLYNCPMKLFYTDFGLIVDKKWEMLQPKINLFLYISMFYSTLMNIFCFLEFENLTINGIVLTLFCLQLGLNLFVLSKTSKHFIKEVNLMNCFLSNIANVLIISGTMISLIQIASPYLRIIGSINSLKTILLNFLAFEEGHFCLTFISNLLTGNVLNFLAILISVLICSFLVSIINNASSAELIRQIWMVKIRNGDPSFFTLPMRIVIVLSFLFILLIQFNSLFSTSYLIFQKSKDQSQFRYLKKKILLMICVEKFLMEFAKKGKNWQDKKFRDYKHYDILSKEDIESKVAKEVGEVEEIEKTKKTVSKNIRGDILNSVIPNLLEGLDDSFGIDQKANLMVSKDSNFMNFKMSNLTFGRINQNKSVSMRNIALKK